MKKKILFIVAVFSGLLCLVIQGNTTNERAWFAGYAEADNPGYVCSSIIKYEGNTLKGLAMVGSQSSTPEDVGKETAIMTQKELHNPGTVDEQLADQLILPLAMAPSGSSYTFDKLYEHVETNLKVINAFLGDILNLQKENAIYRLTKE